MEEKRAESLSMSARVSELARLLRSGGQTDEQLAAGLMMGAEAGIGGTYAVMPELFLAVRRFLQANQVEKAQQLQGDIVRIIEAMLGGHANLYAVMKEYLKRYKGLDLGGVRAPLTGLCPQDDRIVAQAASMIEAAVKKCVLGNSDENYLLIDHSKMGKRSFVKYADTVDYTGILSDEELDIDWRTKITQNGGKLILC